MDLPQLQTLGWDIVRRPTGGQAILHTDELTYAVIGSAAEPSFHGDVLESYKRLSLALLSALEILEIPALALPKPEFESASSVKTPVCFEVPSNYEITVKGKKLIGSAQARKYNGVLQHGSLPLCGDLTRIVLALRFPGENERQTAAKRILHRATTAEFVLERIITWDETAQAFIHAFQKTLNINLIQAEITLDEKELAKRLAKEKYGNMTWISNKEVQLPGDGQGN